MALLINPSREPDRWLAAFRSELPEMHIDVWPDVADPTTVEFVAATRHDLSDLARYPNLRAVLAMGAGVEQYVGDGIPEVPLVRLADPAMSDEMAAYVVHWVVGFQKRFDGYRKQQAQALWRELPYTPAADFVVGILGYGTIGSRIARALASLGFPINAWSRSGTADRSVTSFHGLEELAAFLGSCRAVVNVLPHTAETAGLLNAERFGYFKPGALLVNLGRGATTNEADLVAAIGSGKIALAVLDVAEHEPLDEASALWSHPSVRITPHVAGFTLIPSAAALIAANIKRMLAGDAPFPLVDRQLGY